MEKESCTVLQQPFLYFSAPKSCKKNSARTWRLGAVKTTYSLVVWRGVDLPTIIQKGEFLSVWCGCISSWH